MTRGLTCGTACGSQRRALLHARTGCQATGKLRTVPGLVQPVILAVDADLPALREVREKVTDKLSARIDLDFSPGKPA